MGMNDFVRLARNAYDQGMGFYDMAEAYGSHRFVAEAIKGPPRENLTLLTKITTNGSETASSVRSKPDGFRRETGTGYFDIVLLHCVTSGDWPETRKSAREGLTGAKEDGVVKAVEISCHSLAALREAAKSEWPDVVLARTNPFGSHMDGVPDVVKDVLADAAAKGRGVMDMKIFGEGGRAKDDERERFMRFALTESNIHRMTAGFETVYRIKRRCRPRGPHAGWLIKLPPGETPQPAWPASSAGDRDSPV